MNHTIKETQSLLLSLESVAMDVGLKMNETKTKFMAINFPDDNVRELKTSSGELLEQVDDFMYLGACIGSTEHDFMAW